MIQDVSIPLPDGGTRPGALALPDDTPVPLPGVVILHDIFGLKPDTRRHCERFAEAGFAALAPDLYGGGRVACVVSTLLTMPRERGGALDAIAAARRVLAEQPEVDPRRIGITGFCMGGGFALLAAADDTYAVAAPFYGAAPKERERLSGICPTLAQYGERDRPFLSHAKRLGEHLAALGVPHEVLVHPGVGHSFMNDHPDSWFARMGARGPLKAAYDAPTEKEAWEKMLAFFRAHMPAEGA